MKKILLLFTLFFVFGSLASCTNVRTDYTVDEAFDLMNEAIENFRAAESFHLNYSGMYENESYFAEDRIDVRMRRIGEDNFLGRVEMTIDQNSSSYTSINYYEDGTLYQQRTNSEGVQKIKFLEEPASFIDVYTPWIKKAVDQTKVRNILVQMDREAITVSFELSSAEVENTLFVPKFLTTVRSADVKIVFSHALDLISLDVTFDASIDGVLGTEIYTVVFEKINRYVIITEISNAEKANFELVDPDDEA
jgi:hypothetical protein